MRVWCIIRKIAQLHGIIPGDRCKPEKGGGHQTITATLDQEKNPEAGKHDDSSQPIHIEVERTWYAILQATT
jgi:hypothetical protein